MIAPLLASLAILPTMAAYAGPTQGGQGQMPQRPVVRTILPPIEAPGTKGWTRSPVKPEDLASRVDAQMARLKNTIGEWLATVNLPEGKGRSYGRVVLFAPGRFELDTLRISRARYQEIGKLTWTREGGKTRVLTRTGWAARPDFRALPTPLAPAFLTGFSDATLRATQGAKTFTTLVASARKLGYSILVERRTYTNNQGETDLRLLLTKGATRYAIVISERRMLPNEIRVQGVDPKGVPNRSAWSLAWGTKSTPLTADDVKNYQPSRRTPR